MLLARTRTRLLVSSHSRTLRYLSSSTPRASATASPSSSSPSPPPPPLSPKLDFPLLHLDHKFFELPSPSSSSSSAATFDKEATSLAAPSSPSSLLPFGFLPARYGTRLPATWPHSAPVFSQPVDVEDELSARGSDVAEFALGAVQSYAVMVDLFNGYYSESLYASVDDDEERRDKIMALERTQTCFERDFSHILDVRLCRLLDVQQEQFRAAGVAPYLELQDISAHPYLARFFTTELGQGQERGVDPRVPPSRWDVLLQSAASFFQSDSMAFHISVCFYVREKMHLLPIDDSRTREENSALARQYEEKPETVPRFIQELAERVGVHDRQREKEEEEHAKKRRELMQQIAPNLAADDVPEFTHVHDWVFVTKAESFAQRWSGGDFDTETGKPPLAWSVKNINHILYPY